MIITSYETWEVLEVAHVLQANEVKPGSIFKDKQQQQNNNKNMTRPQNPTMAHSKITKLTMEFGRSHL